jgi:myo-inositol-1-phosphate synthase
VATVTAIGARAIAHGIAGRTGLVTELKELRDLPLAHVEDLVFGGHEVSGRPLMDAAKEFGRRAGILTDRLLDALAEDIAAIQKEIRPGFSTVPIRNIDGTATRTESPAETVKGIQEDLRSFKERNGLSEVVVVNVATTERLPSPRREWDSLTSLRQALDDGDREVFPPSVLYAYASLDAGFPYVNFTPSTGSAVPALDELARARKTVHAGRDGKTGETLVKTTLAPLFAFRNLKVHACRPARPSARARTAASRRSWASSPVTARSTSTTYPASTIGRWPSTTSTSRASSAREWSCNSPGRAATAPSPRP